ncbi:T9SS type A sorting domain-containing protein, partial [Geofilum sp. OHC36d9]|uniref:T9SS type A sorting domain-containing protein n=1 Tax=Geofilum sp. OHC36d9 TaxID=3458413 RepID=UPI004033358F
LGDYEVEIMVSDGELMSNTMDVTITVGTNVSIHAIEQNTTAINVYPNPATTVITVSGSTGVASLYSLDGTKVLVQDLSHSNSINISALPSGLYLLSVDGVIIKVVKE